MSVLFRSGSTDASVQVGEYQEFPARAPECAGAQPPVPKASEWRVVVPRGDAGVARRSRSQVVVVVVVVQRPAVSG